MTPMPLLHSSRVFLFSSFLSMKLAWGPPGTSSIDILDSRTYTRTFRELSGGWASEVYTYNEKDRHKSPANCPILMWTQAASSTPRWNPVQVYSRRRRERRKRNQSVLIALGSAYAISYDGDFSPSYYRCFCSRRMCHTAVT